MINSERTNLQTLYFPKRLSAVFANIVPQIYYKIYSACAYCETGEKEVADLIVQGFTNKQIAERLYVSISTVKMTVSSIFEKTGIESRVQLKENYRKEGAAR